MPHEEETAALVKKKSSGVSRWSLMKRMIPIIGPETVRIVLGIGAIIVNAATNSMFPTVMGQTIDSGGVASSYWEIFVQNAPIFLAGAGASLTRIYCLGTATENISNRLKTMLFRSIFQQEMEYYDANPLGEVVTLLDDDIQPAAELMTERFASAVRSLLSLLLRMYFVYKTSPSISAMTLGVVPAAAIAVVSLERVSTWFRNRLRGLHSSIHSYILERYQNISTVRLNNRENYELEKIGAMLTESKRVANERFLMQGTYMGATNLIGNVTLLVLLQQVGVLLSRDEWTAGNFTSFAMQAGFFGLGAAGTISVYSDINSALDSLERIFRIIDSGNVEQKPTKASQDLSMVRRPESKAKGKTPRVADLKATTSSIYLEGVSFFYKNRPDTLVLRDLSFTIQKNRITCIVGKSGAGKSTLAGILCGLYRPTAGMISYGKNIEIVADEDGSQTGGLNREEQEILHDLFGVVQQSSSTLFTGTVAENIGYGKMGAYQDEIEEAAKQAHAHDFIVALPQGYQTQVGRGGCLLSGGQKARIALARALVKRPKYLLLDEPTSALDSETEKDLIPPLQSLTASSTIVIFTHSDVLKGIAQVIYEIDQGTIIRRDLE